jgi:hypothetical protein
VDGSCGNVAWIVVAVFAAIVLIVCWADVRAALARVWVWLRGRFRKEPKP